MWQDFPPGLACHLVDALQLYRRRKTEKKVQKVNTVQVRILPSPTRKEEYGKIATCKLEKTVLKTPRLRAGQNPKVVT